MFDHFFFHNFINKKENVSPNSVQNRFSIVIENKQKSMDETISIQT